MIRDVTSLITLVTDPELAVAVPDADTTTTCVLSIEPVLLAVWLIDPLDDPPAPPVAVPWSMVMPEVASPPLPPAPLVVVWVIDAAPPVPPVALASNVPVWFASAELLALPPVPPVALPVN